MTIAAGFVHQEGILLCSDSEMQTSTQKGYGSKIAAIQDDEWGTLGITIAGNPDYAVAAIQKVERELAAIRKRDLVWLIETTLKREYEETVFKHPLYAVNGAPDIAYWLILAIFDAKTKKLTLHSTNEATIREFDRYCCEGLGRDAGNSALKNLFRGLPTKEDACKLAVFMLDEVKREVPFCGGPSMLVNFNKDGTVDRVPFDPVKIAHIENVSVYFKQCCGTFVMDHMCPSKEEFDANLQMVIKTGLHIRHLWDTNTFRTDPNAPSAKVSPGAELGRTLDSDQYKR